MCLIAFGWNPSPTLLLLLVANRDEFHARPSAALAAWPDRPDLIAGRDIQAQGTWLGISTRGRLAAVTNVRSPSPQAPGLRSRGRLALDYLADDTTPENHLAAIAADLPHYGPCNLLLADAHSAWYASNRGSAGALPLDRGLYGLSNAALDTPWPKTQRLKSAVQRWLAACDHRDIAPLFAALSDSSTPPDAELPDTGIGLVGERFVAPAFIKGQDYGTRCSTVVVVDVAGYGLVTERRFGPLGRPAGETTLTFRWSQV